MQHFRRVSRTRTVHSTETHTKQLVTEHILKWELLYCSASAVFFPQEKPEQVCGEPEQSLCGEPEQSLCGEPEQSLCGEPEQRLLPCCL